MRKRYSAAYEGSGLNGDEIWEEVVCDALGDMNEFPQYKVGSAAGTLLNEVKENAEAETQIARYLPATDTSIVGKASRDKLIGGEFPPYNISHSDANEWATRWAHQDDVQVGDQRLFSYHGSWYLVEAFDNADMGYQIVEKLTKQQYNAYTKEVDDAEGQSVAERVSRIGESNRQRERLGAGKPSSDNAPAEHRGEDLSVQRVGAERNSRRQAAGDRDGNLPRRRSSIEEARLESVRGYISGDKVFVRADHPAYTADQIMRHEAGHVRIARGEIDVRQIRERIRQRYGIRRTNELSRLYTAAYEGSGLNADEIWEEVVCDSLGDMNIFREFRNGKMAETILREVRIQAESGVQSARGPPQEGANVPTKMSRGNWHSNLPKRQMIELCEWVKRDIRTSKNRVSDTANWAFRMYNGAPEFSIYSTQDLSEPTILYAVKGAQAEYERTYLEKELERIDYGRSIDGESRAINIVLSGSWLLDTGSTGDGDGTVGRERSSGDAGVLRKSSGCKPSAAFESVLRNLLQAEIEQSGGKYSRELGMTSTVDHRGNRSVTDERIQRQMEALKTQYRKVLEAEELDEAFLHGFNMEE